MKRNVALEEISDGRLYDANDMVKADCGGCAGCSECCRKMEDTIELDPLDIHRLSSRLSLSFEELMKRHVGLHVEEGVILPHLSMEGPLSACTFLSDGGRCKIHAFRPGICRLFPLGRYYENRSFRYFLQVNECVKSNRTKIKIRKWMEMPDFAEYEKFVNEWHYFVKDLQEYIVRKPDEAKAVNLHVLMAFYGTPYEDKEFYPQFYMRLKEAQGKIS